MLIQKFIFNSSGYVMLWKIQPMENTDIIQLHPHFHRNLKNLTKEVPAWAKITGLSNKQYAENNFFKKNLTGKNRGRSKTPEHINPWGIPRWNGKWEQKFKPQQKGTEKGRKNPRKNPWGVLCVFTGPTQIQIEFTAMEYSIFCYLLPV